MKLQKVIFHLEDGRKKYATHNGEMLRWERCEVEALERNREWCGNAAYTADFMRYDVVAGDLRKRFHDAKIVRVVGYETEDHDLPLRDDVIF